MSHADAPKWFRTSHQCVLSDERNDANIARPPDTSFKSIYANFFEPMACVGLHLISLYAFPISIFKRKTRGVFPSQILPLQSGHRGVVVAISVNHELESGSDLLKPHTPSAIVLLCPTSKPWPAIPLAPSSRILLLKIIPCPTGDLACQKTHFVSQYIALKSLGWRARAWRRNAGNCCGRRCSLVFRRRGGFLLRLRGWRWGGGMSGRRERR